MTRLSNAALRSEVSKLKELVVDLTEKHDQLLIENTFLKERLAVYEHRLNKTSRNSSKPPSSDGLGKPKAAVKPAKGSRPSGGQAGHKGHTLRRSNKVDHILDHRPTSCAHCGSSLAADQEAMVAKVRQVQDLPARQPLVITDHRVLTCQCERCGETTIGSFPTEVKAPVQYGPRLQQQVVYLGVEQLLPIRRIGQVINTFCGARLSEGTICNYIKSFAKRFQPVHTHLGDLVKQAPVAHFDETGMRVKGSLNWFHVGTTEAFCYFWLGQSRGDVMTGAQGIVVHDHWPPYQSKMPQVQHAFCLAHLARECTGLAEMGEQWTGKMADLFNDIMKVTKPGNSLSAKVVAMMEGRFDRLLQEGITYHNQLDPLPKKGRGRPKRRKGHNLVHRLYNYREGTLMCLHNPLVPATNNLAERDIRVLKLKMKISGSFRQKEGARDFAILRSVLETARKQGWNALATLGTKADVLIEQLAPEKPVPNT